MSIENLIRRAKRGDFDFKLFGELIKKIKEIPEADAKRLKRLERLYLNAFLKKNVSQNIEPAIKEAALKPIEARLSKSLGEMGEKIAKAIDGGLRSGEANELIAKEINKSLKAGTRHTLTNVNSLRMGLAGAQNFEKAKSDGIKFFRYTGASKNIRPFCSERLGKIYSEKEIRQMDNGQGLPVEYYCGGYNCRHRWLAVAEGRLTIADGAKIDERERRACDVLIGNGLNVEIIKPTGKGKTHDAFINKIPAEIKTLTSDTADGNEIERIRQALRAANKQKAEWAVLNIEKEASEKLISAGIEKYTERHSKSNIKKISTIIKSNLNTIEVQNANTKS